MQKTDYSAVGETLYSSCAVVIGGELKHNYRRISRGWKEFNRTDAHYREGVETLEFAYHGQKLMLALQVFGILIYCHNNDKLIVLVRIIVD